MSYLLSLLSHGFLDPAHETLFESMPQEDLEITNEDGETALILAARNAHFNVVSILIHKGANLNALSDYGYTALSVSLFNYYFKISALLLSSDADIHLTGEGEFNPLRLAIESMEDSLPFIKTLLNQGADPWYIPQDGKNALTAALCLNRLSMELLEIILEQAKDLNGVALFEHNITTCKAWIIDNHHDSANRLKTAQAMMQAKRWQFELKVSDQEIKPVKI